jgi:hypothetical protein
VRGDEFAGLRPPDDVDDGEVRRDDPDGDVVDDDVRPAVAARRGEPLAVDDRARVHGVVVRLGRAESDVVTHEQRVPVGEPDGEPLAVGRPRGQRDVGVRHRRRAPVAGLAPSQQRGGEFAQEVDDALVGLAVARAAPDEARLLEADHRGLDGGDLRGDRVHPFGNAAVPHRRELLVDHLGIDGIGVQEVE